MLSAEGNSAAGVGGRPFFRAVIYNWRAVFSKLCLIHTLTFSLTNFTLFSGSNYNGWYPWFVGLWVLGGGKSGEPVTKICEKNVKIFEKMHFFQNLFFWKVNRFWEFLGFQEIFLGSLLPLGFPGGNQVDGSSAAAMWKIWFFLKILILFGNDLRVFSWSFCEFRGVFSCMKLYGLPGGNQVDGLPPAASQPYLAIRCSTCGRR